MHIQNHVILRFLLLNCCSWNCSRVPELSLNWSGIVLELFLNCVGLIVLGQGKGQGLSGGQGEAEGRGEGQGQRQGYFSSWLVPALFLITPDFMNGLVRFVEFNLYDCVADLFLNCSWIGSWSFVSWVVHFCWLNLSWFFMIVSLSCSWIVPQLVLCFKRFFSWLFFFSVTQAHVTHSGNHWPVFKGSRGSQVSWTIVFCHVQEGG